MSEVSDCLSRADILATGILESKKPVRDIVYKQLIGKVPRLTLEELETLMSPDELRAMEIIRTMREEYKGLFADFPQPEARKKSRPETPPPVAPPPDEGAKPLPAPKVSKAQVQEAKRVGLCINNLIAPSRDEAIVRAASALCLCGKNLINARH